MGGREVPAAMALGLVAGIRSQRAHRFLSDATTFADPGVDLGALMGHRQEVTDLHPLNIAEA